MADPANGDQTDSSPLPPQQQVKSPVPVPADVGADESQLAQPGYDPEQALADQLSSLRADLPGYQPPDTSAQDKAISQYRMTAEEADKRAQAITLQRSDYEEKIANEMHQQEKQFNALFAQYPSAQVFHGAGLQAAPVLSMLAVLGGKAAGLSGRAMLGSLNGMMQGLNEGAEEAFQHSLEQWKAQLEQYKMRHEQQLEIYKLMLDAYKDRSDAALKARDFALDMTKDTMDERDKIVKSSIDIFRARTEAITSIDKLTALFGQHAQRAAYDKLSSNAYIYWQRDVAANTVPANAKTGVLRNQYYENLAKQHPNPDQFDNVQFHKDQKMSPKAQEFAVAYGNAGISIPGVYSQAGRTTFFERLAKEHADWTGDDAVKNARGERAATTVAQTAARTVGTQESRVVVSAADLFSGPGSFANRLEAAAQKVDFGSAVVASKTRLWMQGNVWSGDDLSLYLSQLTDFRSKMTTLLQNGGMSTEGAQHRAQELLPTPSSLSALRKILDNSRAVAVQLEGQNAQILQGLRSGAPIDQIINLAKVPMNKGAQPQSPGRSAPTTPGTPGAAGPPQQGQPPQSKDGKKRPNIPVGSISIIDGVKYRKVENGWVTVH